MKTKLWITTAFTVVVLFAALAFTQTTWAGSHLPRNVAVEKIDDRPSEEFIEVTWDAPSTGEASAYRVTRIYYKNWLSKKTNKWYYQPYYNYYNVNGKLWTDRHATKNILHGYRVAAKHCNDSECEWTDETEEVDWFTHDPGPPKADRPWGVIAKPHESKYVTGTVIIKWNAPTDLDFDGYRVIYKEHDGRNNSPDWLTAECAEGSGQFHKVTDRRCTHAGLEKWYRYTYRVQAMQGLQQHPRSRYWNIVVRR